MSLRYAETGEGLQGYQWVKLSEVTRGTVVYYHGRDVYVERVDIAEQAGVRTEPVVYVLDPDTLQPDSFRCDSKIMPLLIKG